MTIEITYLLNGHQLKMTLSDCESVDQAVSAWREWAEKEMGKTKIAITAPVVIALIENAERPIDVAFDCISADVPQCNRCSDPCDDSIDEYHAEVHGVKSNP